MEHPILKSRLGIPIYVAAWFLFAATVFLLGWYFDKNAVYEAFVYSVSFSVPLFILGFCIWFVVAHTSINKLAVRDFVLQHVSASVIVIILWLSAAYFIRIELLGKAWETYNLVIPLHWQAFFAFCMYGYIVMVYYLIIYYQDLKDKLLHETELKDLVKEAELTALKSQINPHFLFNSLNSASSLTLSKPEQSRDMIVKLSDFLRYSLDQDLKELNELKNELSNIRLYLEIEKVRFSDRLQLVFDSSPECENFKLPNLILQPVFENAIKHGVHESLEPVTIKTVCRIHEGKLKISIGNNFDSESIPPKGKGIGLRNIQERLRLIYGRADLMRIKKEENYFEVNFEFPQTKPTWKQ